MGLTVNRQMVKKLFDNGNFTVVEAVILAVILPSTVK